MRGKRKKADVEQAQSQLKQSLQTFTPTNSLALESMRPTHSRICFAMA